MQRMTRILRTARHELWMGLMFLAVGVAAGVWALAVVMDGNVPGGASLAAAAVSAFGMAGLHGREWLRLRRMLRIEAYWESLRAIRPRI